ncbi:MAG: DUF2730 family protein [Bilophila sp.]
MTLQELVSDWGAALNWLVPLLCGWIWWSARQKFVLKDEQAALARRVSELENAVKDIPDEATMLELRLSLQEMRGEFKAFNAKLEGLQTNVAAVRTNIDMLMQHHLDERK